jgi:hypothetical protein
MPKRTPQDVLRSYITHNPVDRAIAKFVKRMRSADQSDSSVTKGLMALGLLVVHGTDARQFVDTLIPGGSQLANDAARDLDGLAMLRYMNASETPSASNAPVKSATNRTPEPMSSETGSQIHASHIPHSVEPTPAPISTTTDRPIAPSDGGDLKTRWRAMSIGQSIAVTPPKSM